MERLHWNDCLMELFEAESVTRCLRRNVRLCANAVNNN